MRLRRALALSAADRYVSMVIGALVIAAVSRILSPEEVGVTVLGMTLFALVDLVRDIPTTYLVQRHEVTGATTRAAFTVMLGISAVAAAIVFLAAPALAAYQGEEGLTGFFRVLALALLLGPFERPLTALLRRELAFGRVALVNVTSVVANAVLMVGLALLGFSYMAFAWALVGSGLVTLVVAHAVGDRRHVIGLTRRGWTEALRIGGASGLWGLISRLTDTVPHIVFGAHGMLATVGLYGRAQTVADMPGKLLLAAIWPVALPALAARQRGGEGLKGPVLNAIGLLSAVQWPALLVLACLAHPATLILLGPQWLSVVPVVQVMLVARLLAPIDVVVYPVLMAQGRTLRLLMSVVLPMPVYVMVIVLAAPHGLMAVALSFLVLVPLYSVVGYVCIRGPLALGLADLARALGKSAVAAGGAVAGPAVVLAMEGFRFDISIPMAMLSGILACAGWSAALAATGHPLWAELKRSFDVVRHRTAPHFGARP
ncbi:oligosaccharide flippase family protein [Roseomonas eburnea]|uniref:Oligosaccharide flippase family protein n=1 Tax=Neoroseomonas eburnea TaxID=1346889 RepID=A0A9X9X5S5_9PROT|nr:oligosaccharide flippase family protein [Neoroseomonas eburnea]MBR0679061.1 oligosaccharide flippase family protein [Neoroseomonas eburnea]